MVRDRAVVPSSGVCGIFSEGWLLAFYHSFMMRSGLAFYEIKVGKSFIVMILEKTLGERVLNGHSIITYLYFKKREIDWR